MDLFKFYYKYEKNEGVLVFGVNMVFGFENQGIVGFLS